MYARTGPDLYVHRTVAAAALGRPLPRGVVVHHVDGDRTNNTPTNLVICPNQSYHMLLHARERVIDAGGNPNTDKFCSTCQECKSGTEFATSPKKYLGRSNECRACCNLRRRKAA